VEGEVIVEVKSVREITPIHRAQLLTYLELSGRHLRLLTSVDLRAPLWSAPRQRWRWTLAHRIAISAAVT
jgi:hypothetical protein